MPPNLDLLLTPNEGDTGEWSPATCAVDQAQAATSWYGHPRFETYAARARLREGIREQRRRRPRNSDELHDALRRRWQFDDWRVVEFAFPALGVLIGTLLLIAVSDAAGLTAIYFSFAVFCGLDYLGDRNGHARSLLPYGLDRLGAACFLALAALAVVAGS